MVMVIVSVATWLLLGWKIGLALTLGALLECIEAAFILRSVSRLKRENAYLVEVTNSLARDLERSVAYYFEEHADRSEDSSQCESAE
jgi:hypothetical protein